MIDDLLQRRPYNAAADFVDANVARGLGGKVAFTDSSRSLTYGELQEKSCRFAAGLEGARAARGEPRHPAAARHRRSSGGVLGRDPRRHRADPGQHAADRRAICLSVRRQPRRRRGDRGAAARHAAVDPPAAAAPARRSSSSMRRDGTRLPPDVHRFEDVLARAEPSHGCAPTMSDEVAFWIYTSGSTGDPKAVRHVHTTMMAASRLMGQRVIGIREDDVVFSAAKLSFSYGLGNAMAFPMSVGASAALLPERPTPQAVLAAIRRHRPTIFYAVPSLYGALLAHPEIGKGAGSDRLRLCISAGEALPASLGRALARGHRRRRARRASARPRCSRPSSATGRTTSATARPASRCPATSSRSSTRTAATCRTARSANSWCAGRRPAKATGTSAPRAAAPSRANGPIRATSSCATPRATTTAAAAPTTCSRSTACGCRRSRSRPRSPRTRRCWRPA